MWFINDTRYSKLIYSHVQFYNSQEEKLNVKVMWDTGSPITVLKKSIISQLNLTPDGDKKKFYHAGDFTMNDCYRVNLLIPENILIENLQIAEWMINYDVKECDAIIGMDIISKGDFTISNHHGVMMVCFRYPSAWNINLLNQDISPFDLS